MLGPSHCDQIWPNLATRFAKSFTHLGQLIFISENGRASQNILILAIWSHWSASAISDQLELFAGSGDS